MRARSGRLGAALHPLGGEADPGQLGQGPAALGERLLAAHPGHHPTQPRAQRAGGDVQLPVPRGQAVAAGGAVVPGALELDLAEHSVQELGSIAHELGVVALVAGDPRPPMTGVDREEILQERAAQLQHGGADRQLDGAQAVPSGVAELGRRQLAEPGYLRVKMRCTIHPVLYPSGSEPPGGLKPPLVGVALIATGLMMLAWWRLRAARC